MIARGSTRRWVRGCAALALAASSMLAPWEASTASAEDDARVLETEPVDSGADLFAAPSAPWAASDRVDGDKTKDKDDEKAKKDLEKKQKDLEKLMRKQEKLLRKLEKRDAKRQRGLSVQLEPGSEIATLEKLSDDYGVTVAGGIVSEDIYLLVATREVDVLPLETVLGRDGRIDFARAVKKGTLVNATPFDNYIWGVQNPGTLYSQYAFGMLGFGSGANSAHGLSTGQGVTVAIIDTSFELVHPLLNGHWSPTATHWDFIDNDRSVGSVPNRIDDDGDGQIDEAFGHGTFVAGVVRQVAPNAKIMPLRVLDDDGQAYDYDVAEAIMHAIAHGADIINLSLVTQENAQVIEYAVSEAANAGILVVAAAGNSATTAPQYPAASACAIAVASVGPGGYVSSFANFGPWVDVVAPGEKIASAFPASPIPGGGGSFEYAYWSGSSVSAPFVAGQAALIASRQQGATPADLAAYVAGTSASVDGSNPGYGGMLGFGLPNAFAGLQSAQMGPPPGGANLPLAACNQAP